MFFLLLHSIDFKTLRHQETLIRQSIQIGEQQTELSGSSEFNYCK